jgi:hypothetical protein
MPAVRLGLNIFYDVMKSPDALELNKPLTIDKVHKFSSNFQNALASHRFADSRARFLEAKGQLPRIFEDDEDQEIAEAILTILYLHYVISGHHGRATNDSHPGRNDGQDPSVGV